MTKKDMGLYAKLISSFLVIFILNLSSAVAVPKPPPEMEAWLKASKLGPYDTGAENWDEIVKKANAEGEVVVYSSSGRIQKLVKPFAKIYPGIKLTVHDLGSTKSVVKTKKEQEAGIFNADVVTTGNSGQVIHEMLNKNLLVNYVPHHFKSRIPKAFRDPLLIRVNEAVVFFYNMEEYPKNPPVTNIWEFTEPKFKARVGMKNPLSSGSTLMAVMTLIQYPKEMAAAYKRYKGENIKLSEGVPDAGYEFWARMLKNDLVIFKSGSKLAGATGKKDQNKPLIGFINMTYIARNDSKGYVNAIVQELDPVSKLVYPTFTAIARQAPHPNAAKVFTAFALGSTELNKSSKITKPYTKGKSLDLLLGLAPYFDPGTRSPRNDVPSPEGGEIWDDMKAWHVDAEFMWKQGAKIRDFWIQHSSM
ncbi:MAG: solute-binding protein [Candidatus Marinimicrobia bacterium]|jgi:iron(III) transport system substrate-binding protein|nr:solute-binding protein [Candidatus Neomarinimicrobiota bacterium]